MCRKLGISNSALSGYERDYREPDAETLSRLAQLYEVSIDYLINGSNKTIDNDDKKSENFSRIDKQGNVFIPGLRPEFFPVGRLVYVPIVAEISCGEPVFTEDNIIGTYPVDTQFIPITNVREYVFVRAVGDSMVNANITDGSLVLIHLQPEVENGDIAAVCVDNEAATLKRVYVNDFAVTLVPENPSMPPMTYEKHRVRIVGKAVSVTTTL